MSPGVITQVLGRVHQNVRFDLLMHRPAITPKKSFQWWPFPPITLLTGHPRAPLVHGSATWHRPSRMGAGRVPTRFTRRVDLLGNRPVLKTRPFKTGSRQQIGEQKKRALNRSNIMDAAGCDFTFAVKTT